MPRSCHIDFSWYGLKYTQITRPNNRRGALLTVIKPKYNRYDVTSSAHNVTLMITWPTRGTGVIENNKINCVTREWAHVLLSDLIDLSHCWLNVFHLLLFSSCIDKSEYVLWKMARYIQWDVGNWNFTLQNHKRLLGWISSDFRGQTQWNVCEKDRFLSVWLQMVFINVISAFWV